MADGTIKSQNLQRGSIVATLFHIGTTKYHPPIPDHLSSEAKDAKDFLLKCLEGVIGVKLVFF
ncbi:mitogen-activated protein kinase kinase kinase NPK1 [Artemisia annua]|uniref:Mitogen-activated protein kinase kinase kinase NPK1 n=1 Tax=Artemisia annua TaxID=35608 RepID=A0A2U1NJJ5_ARTAN|nr:mitogen-activated protein kinase kinase kinase NPK1 [Artemisia annua]